jgi:hypothetical protein
MTDLNTLLPAASGWELVDATATNDVGQIVGSGIINGQSHGFLLDTGTMANSVPEPGSVTVGCEKRASELAPPS